MEAQTRNSGSLDEKSELSLDGLMPLNAIATESESIGNDFSSSSRSILEEMDSFMDELGGLLTVSRMVSNSVIKGIVSAIEQEFAEKTSSKEDGITNLNSKLQNYDVILENCKKVTDSIDENLLFGHSKFNSSSISPIEYLNRLRIEAEKWIQKLKKEIKRVMRTDFYKSDALHVEVRQCRNYSQTEDIHKFDIVEGCIHSLETLLTDMSMYAIAIISSGKTMICDHDESEKYVEIDNSIAMLENLITGLHHEYETNIRDKQILMNEFKEKGKRKSARLADIRLELHDLCKSFISWEPGSIFPHVNHGILEEQNALRRKDQAHQKPAGNNISFHDEDCSVLTERVEEPEKPINFDSPQLMSMNKEDLISYFKTQMIEMKRQHDVALQEKTEELFSLKRDFFKEKGSHHLNFKKDREVELVRKRITEIVSKLDDIISENECLSTILDDDSLCSFREKTDSILLENKRLASLLAAKKKETIPDCSKVLDTSNHLPNIFASLGYVDQLEKVQWDMETLKVEMSIKDVINISVLSQVSAELRERVEDIEMETEVDQCMYSLVLREVVSDVLSRITTVMMKCYEENNSVSEDLLEKKKALCLEVDKNKILKQQIESSSRLLKMKEQLASDLETAIMKQSKEFDSICCERDMLRDQGIKKKVIIAESKKEFDLLKCRLEDKCHEIDQLQTEISKLKQTVKAVSATLLDAEIEKNILQSELGENQAEHASEIKKGEEQRMQMKLILTSILELPAKFLEELEHKVTDIMACNESRLKVLRCQCDALSQRAKKFQWYREAFERRCEDLLKAETEVDLLGDEVDNLISLLSKIYLALEHYSSVLQYYPGVMETLNMIRREIKR